MDLTYTGRERSFVAWSAILGYAFDFYNLIIMAFLLTQIQKSLGMTLPQTGLIVSMTLTGSVIGGVAIGWLGDQIGRKNALLASLALLAAGSILSAFAWDFVSLLAFRFITGIGVGGEWGAGMVLLNEVLAQRPPRLRFLRGAGDVGGRHRDCGLGRDLRADQSERESVLARGTPRRRAADFPDDLHPRENAGIAAVERIRAGKSGALPPEKAAERTSILEILRGASLKYFIIGTLMCGAYIISYQAISIFMPTLMIRDLHANPGAVRTVTLIWSAFSATGLLLAGLASDHFGRKRAVLASTCVCIIGFVAIYLFGRVDYPGAVLSWPLFWCYALWGLGQGSIGVFGPWYSELFPVELRSTGASVTFTAGRLIGSAMPYLVPVIAALLGNLFSAMMFGIVGAVLSLLFALFLPETAGRKFAVIEGKEHG